MIKRIVISHWHISIRKVLWITLERYREFRFVFDAKECASDTFPLQNIHAHQVAFMKDFEEQGGISFLLIYFSKYERCFYLRFEKMMEFWNRQFCGETEALQISRNGAGI